MCLFSVIIYPLRYLLKCLWTGFPSWYRIPLSLLPNSGTFFLSLLFVLWHITPPFCLGGRIITICIFKGDCHSHDKRPKLEPCFFYLIVYKEYSDTLVQENIAIRTSTVRSPQCVFPWNIPLCRSIW